MNARADRRLINHGLCCVLPLLFEYVYIVYAARIRFIILLKRRPALNCFDFVFNVNQRELQGSSFVHARSQFICPQHLCAAPDRARRRHFYSRARL
jgi:hypothetical protein